MCPKFATGLLFLLNIWSLCPHRETKEMKSRSLFREVYKKKIQKTPITITPLSQLYWYYRQMYLWPKLLSLNVSIYSACLDTSWTLRCFSYSQKVHILDNLFFPLACEHKGKQKMHAAATDFCKGPRHWLSESSRSAHFVPWFPLLQKCTGFYLQDALDLMRRFSGDPIFFFFVKKNKREK